MVHKIKLHSDSSSSSSDDDAAPDSKKYKANVLLLSSASASARAPPFLLQVPPTYANKHPALVDRNGLVSSSLSEQSSTHQQRTRSRHRRENNSNFVNNNNNSSSSSSNNTHKVTQQREETWKRPDLFSTRFQVGDGSLMDDTFMNNSGRVPSCATPRVALPPVKHKFRLAISDYEEAVEDNEEKKKRSLSSLSQGTSMSRDSSVPTAATNTEGSRGKGNGKFFLATRTKRPNPSSSSSAISNLIPALVLPQHDAQKLLERDLDMILESNASLSRTSGAKVQTARTVSDPPQSQLHQQQEAERVTNNNTITNVGLLSHHTFQTDKKLLSQTARAPPPPPPFSSTKISVPLMDSHSFLDDKHADGKMNALKRSNGKIILAHNNSNNNNNNVGESKGDDREDSCRATSKLSVPGSVASVSTSPSIVSRHRSGARRTMHAVVVASKHTAQSSPPNEDDYIEDALEDARSFSSQREWTRNALDHFDQHTLPPVIAATRMKLASIGRGMMSDYRQNNNNTTATTNNNVSAVGGPNSVLGNDGGNKAKNNNSNTTSNFVGDERVGCISSNLSSPSSPVLDASGMLLPLRLSKDGKPPALHSPVISGETSGISEEAATGRVARTLFHAGLCQNLQVYEKLKTKISAQDLERKLQGDFVHRRQVSKEDFVVFLARALREEHINRREVDMLWTLLDSNGNGVLETRELRTELLKFVKTGMRDISFNFVAQLLEGRETQACNAFISRFDIQNIVNAVINFYKDDAEVCSSVRDLPDKFQYKHHLARIPIAVLRDRILGDRKLLAIFQAVALEARKTKLEEYTAKGIPFTSALGHFAPMSIPQHYNNQATSAGTNKLEASLTLNSTAGSLGATARSVVVGGGGERNLEASARNHHHDRSHHHNYNSSPQASPTTANTNQFPTSVSATPSLGQNPQPQQQAPQATTATTIMNIRSTSSHQYHLNGEDPNTIYLVGPKSEQFVDRFGELANAGKRRSSRQHNVCGGGGTVRVEPSAAQTPTTSFSPSNSMIGNSDSNNNNNNNNNNNVKKPYNVGGSRRSSQQSNNNQQLQAPPTNASLVRSGDNSTPTTKRKAVAAGELRRKPSNIAQQLAQFDHDLNDKSNSSANGGPGLPSQPSQASAAGIVRMIANPITSADRFVSDDVKRQEEAAETGNPTWYTKANVLYVESGDNHQARPVFQAFAT